MANNGGYGRENNNDDGSGLTANNGGYGLATHHRVIVGEVEWMERSA